MGSGLSLLAAQDPTLILRNESEIGQTTLSGMGELHLKVMLSRLKDATPEPIPQKNTGHFHASMKTDPPSIVAL